jgi:copper chaperone CopZ
LSASADVTAKITDVHLCCKGCVTGAEKALGTVPDAKSSVDMEERTITLTGPDAATVQKAADALVKAGYYGKSETVKLTSNTGAKGQKVQSATVEGVHLCCPKCVKAVDRALKEVPGAKEHTAVKGAKSFQVTGDFNDKELMTALQKEGLTGKLDAGKAEAK